MFYRGCVRSGISFSALCAWIVVKQPAPHRPNSVSIEVLEPEDPPLPRLALPPPPSQETYHIPGLSAPDQIKKKVHRLSAKKAAVLADRQAKL